MKRLGSLIFAAALAPLLPAGPATAQSSAQELAPAAASISKSDTFSRFTPRPSGSKTAIDFSVYDDLLAYFVFNMGQSIREGAPTRQAEVGTRLIYGHDSRLRLEGNRVLYSFITPELLLAIKEYRQELETIPGRVDFTALPRNEQLAYWINLHNIAVIEKIAENYPLSRPVDLKIGAQKLLFDDAPFLTVAGVPMSLKDIRTKIVYPNWKSADVIYGFYHGDIGGPSIQTDAFTGKMAGIMLENSAREFINSLRGTQKSGKTLKVSKLYEEARPYYFTNWGQDMREHLQMYSKTDVQKIIEETSEIVPSIYEYDIADMEKGERDPNYSFVMSDGHVKGNGLPAAIQALLKEYKAKEEKLEDRKERQGTVTVLPVTLPGMEETANEVD